jgi:ankyrin repeat protein
MTNAKLQLSDAICKNDTVTASSLISSGSVNLNGKPWPLLHAAERGRVEIMTRCSTPVPTSMPSTKDNVLRVYRNFDNHFDALKLLVERGTNLGVVDSNGQSLLSFVAQYVKHEPFVIFLLDAGAPIDRLSNADLMDLVKSVAVFDRLMARGVNFTAMRDEVGATLCHHVARNVSCENDFRFLVNVCGNNAVQSVDDDGRSPLHWASPSGNDSAIRVLVELGAEIDRQDNGGGLRCTMLPGTCNRHV